MSGWPGRRRKVLGIDLGPGALRVAEARIGRGRRSIRRVGEFRFPEGATLQEPEALGKALRRFLDDGGFRARVAVVGLGAQDLLSFTAEVPATDPEALASLLRIRAERELSTALDDVALDHTGRERASGGAPGDPLLVVATRQELVRQVEAMARSAGLLLRAVTSTILTVASALPPPETDPEWLLLLGLDGGELVLRSRHGCRHPRHLAAGETGNTETLRRGLRRHLWSVPAETAGPPTALRVVDGRARLPRERPLDALGEGLSLSTRVEPDTAWLATDRTPFAEPADGLPHAAASALALSERRTVDFLHTRMAVRRRPRLGRRRALLGAAVIVLLVLGATELALLDARTREDIALLDRHLHEMEPEMAEARRVVQMVSRTRGWYDQRPPFLECLRALTLALPADGGVWTTSLAAREDMRFVVSGRAADRRILLEVLDRLKASAAFAEVKLLDMRGAEREGREVGFSCSFVFVGEG